MLDPVIADTLGAIPPPEVPRGALPSFSELFLGDAPNAVAASLAMAGDALWVVAYLLFIRIGFKDRTYGVPFVAVCLNFTWELWFAVIRPPADTATHMLHLAWFVLDVVIVWQLLRYGRKEQAIPELRRWFYAVVGGTMILALAGQVTYYGQITRNALFPDTQAASIAWMIALVMSVLFVFVYFARPDRRGLSYWGAWGMLAGNALLAIANTMVFVRHPRVDFQLRIQEVGTAGWTPAGTVGTDTVDVGFIYFLFLATLFFNALYVALLHASRGRPVS